MMSGFREGDSENEPESYSRVYEPEELWLEIVDVTNGSTHFVTHTPEINAVYDLFGTTNLNPVTNLNVANWMWLLRTSAGQTNLVLTNLWPDTGLHPIAHHWRIESTIGLVFKITFVIVAPTSHEHRRENPFVPQILRSAPC